MGTTSQKEKYIRAQIDVLNCDSETDFMTVSVFNAEDWTEGQNIIF